MQGVCLRDCASVHVTVEDESPSPPSQGPQMKIALPPPPPTLPTSTYAGTWPFSSTLKEKAAVNKVIL